MSSTQTSGRTITTSKIEAILASMDDIKRAQAPPFLYERIQARLRSAEYTPPEKIVFFISRPAIVISFLLLILFVDGIVIRSTFASPSEKTEYTGEEFLTNDDSVETLFYETGESEIASIY